MARTKKVNFTKVVEKIKQNARNRKPKKKTQAIKISNYQMGIKDLALSIADPFSKSACIPDGRTGVGCFSTKATGTLSTGAAGSCCGVAVMGCAYGQYYVDTASTAATPTISGNWLSQGQTASAANYQSYRPVSYGIRVNYIGNTQTDQGVIVVGQLPNTEALSTLNGLNAASVAADSQYYKVIPLRNGAQVTWRPEMQQSMSVWNNYGPATTISVNNSPPGNVNVIYCWVFGASSSSTPIQYEIIVNFEGMFDNMAFIPGGLNVQTAEPALPGWYEQAKNVVMDIAPIIPLVGTVLSATGYGTAANVFSLMGNGLGYKANLDKQSRSV